MRMRVPKGKPVHENLSTSYVKVGALLADLQVREFTGYVHIGYRGYDAYVFLDAGVIIGAIEQTDKASRVGSEAVDGLLVRSEQRDGSVSIYDHASQTVQALAGIIDGNIVYQGLSSEFTDLDKLIRKLSKDQDTTWYVEAVAAEERAVGVLYIHGGKADGVYSSPDGVTLSGQAALKAMLEMSDVHGATYDVYAVATTEVTIAPVAEPEPAAKRLAVVASLPAPAPPPPAPVAVPSARISVPKSESSDDMAPLVLLMSDVVATIENAVVSREGPGGFAIELRAGQLDVADRYPFLDPFAAEFEYHAGEIAFVGNVDPEDFAIGLGEALRVAVAGLSRRDVPDGEKVRARISSSLAELYENRQAEFDAFGLAGLLSYIYEPEVEDAAPTGTDDQA